MIITHVMVLVGYLTEKSKVSKVKSFGKTNSFSQCKVKLREGLYESVSEKSVKEE